MSAYSTASARSDLKNRCGLATTDYDTLIDSIILQAVNRFQPDFAMPGTDFVTFTATPADSEVRVAFSALPGFPIQVTNVEYYSIASKVWTDDCRVSVLGGSVLRIRELPYNTTQFRCLPYIAYVLTTLPDVLQPALMWLAQAEFYSTVIGQKRKFNAYMQSRSTSVEELSDLIEMYEQKAKDYLDARRPAYVT